MLLHGEEEGLDGWMGWLCVASAAGYITAEGDKCRSGPLLGKKRCVPGE